MGVGLLKELKFLRVFQSKSTVVLKIKLMKNLLNKSYYHYHKNSTGKFLSSIFIFLISLLLVHAIRNFEQNLGSSFCAF